MILSIALVMLLVFSSFMSLAMVDRFDTDKKISIKELRAVKAESRTRGTPREIIHIEGNDALNASNGVTSGSGTAQDPYFIEGWDINGTGNNSCIYIVNTTDHFIIKDCILFSTNKAIYIENASNAEVENCDISDCNRGVEFRWVLKWTVKDCTMSVVDYGVYYYIDESSWVGDVTFGDMLLDNNFITITNNRAGFYFNIDLDYNDGGPYDIVFGDITLTGNTVFQNGTSGQGLAFSDLGVDNLDGGSITMGDITISENIVHKGNYGFDFYGYFSYLTDVQVTVGDMIVNDNEVYGQNHEGLDIDYYDAEYWYGTSSGIFGDLHIFNNTVVSEESGSMGVGIDDYTYWEYYYDDAQIKVGNLTIDNNEFDVRADGIYVAYAYFGYYFYNNARSTIGNVTITNNNIYNCAEGVYLYYEYVYDIYDNAYVAFDQFNIIGNMINASSYGIEIYFDEVGYGMNDTAELYMGEFNIFDNVITSVDDGIYFYTDDYFGYDMYDDSKLTLGDVTIVNNTIDSEDDGFYFYLYESAYYNYNNTNVTIGDFKFVNNTMDAIAYGLYIYYNEIGYSLEDQASFYQGLWLIEGNTINSGDDGIYWEYYEYYLGSYSLDNTTIEAPDVFILNNYIDSDTECIEYYSYSNPDDAEDYSWTDFGTWVIDGNTLTGNYGIYYYLEDVQETGYDHASATIGDIIISNNLIYDVGTDGIYLYLDDIIYNYTDSGSMNMGNVHVGGNTIDNCSGYGIYVYYYIYSDEMGNITFDNLEIVGNHINNTYSDGIYIDYYLYNYDAGTLNFKDILIEDNILSNIDANGIYYYYYGDPIHQSTVITGTQMIANNSIINCTDNGIYFYQYYDQGPDALFNHGDTYISNNYIKECPRGIYVYDSENITVSSNILMDNDAGLNLSESKHITVYDNYFDNVIDVEGVGTNNTWNISKTPGRNIVNGPFLGGNFWANYTGDDMDYDGFGDTNVPYNSSNAIPDGGDHLPLVKDEVIPTVMYENDTYVDGIFINWDHIRVNVSGSDLYFHGIRINLYNETEKIMEEVGYSTNFAFVFTNLEDGVYSFDAEAFDTFTNTNTTEMRTITVDATAPTVVAGNDTTIDEDTALMFNGSQSYDNGTGIVNYTWTVEGVQYYTEMAEHIFPDPGVFEVVLNITDFVGNWAVDTLMVTVRDLTMPTADIGGNKTVDEDAVVELNASMSMDNGEIVNYTWTVEGEDHYGMIVEHIFPEPGDYQVQLNVTDAAGHYDIDTATIFVRDITNPIAHAGDDQTVIAGETMTLNGSASTDNVEVFNYTWTFQYMNGTTVLYGAQPDFTFALTGVYNVTLNVSDEAGNYATDNVIITVKEVIINAFDLTIKVVPKNATVKVNGNSVTLENGTVTMKDLVTGLYNIEVSKQGYETATRTVNLTEDKNISIVLKKIVPEDVDVSIGPVLDEDGEPIEGASVTLTIDGQTYTGVTNAQGIAVIPVPPTAMGKNVTVKITKDGYEDISYTTSLDANGDLTTQPPQMVMDEGKGSGGSSLTWLWILLVIIVVIAVIIFFMTRKKDEEEKPVESDEEEEKDEEEEDLEDDDAEEDEDDFEDDDEEIDAILDGDTDDEESESDEEEPESEEDESEVEDEEEPESEDEPEDDEGETEELELDEDEPESEDADESEDSWDDDDEMADFDEEPDFEDDDDVGEWDSPSSDDADDLDDSDDLDDEDWDNENEWDSDDDEDVWD